jgi:hypothetical protein
MMESRMTKIGVLKRKTDLFPSNNDIMLCAALQNNDKLKSSRLSSTVDPFRSQNAAAVGRRYRRW